MEPIPGCVEGLRAREQDCKRNVAQSEGLRSIRTNARQAAKASVGEPVTDATEISNN